MCPLGAAGVAEGRQRNFLGRDGVGQGTGAAWPAGGHRAAATATRAVVQRRAGSVYSSPHPHEAPTPSSGESGPVVTPATVQGGILYKCTSARTTRCLPWMKEEKGIIHRGEGAFLRCPVSSSVHFSLRNEGSSEYIRLCDGRESLSPNFETFQDPRHQSIPMN
jgi:hypothetical protein